MPAKPKLVFIDGWPEVGGPLNGYSHDPTLAESQRLFETLHPELAAAIKAAKPGTTKIVVKARVRGA